jgi:hypothetical protein
MSQPKDLRNIIPGALAEVRPGQTEVPAPEGEPGRMRRLQERRALLDRQRTELRREGLQRKGGIRDVGAGELTALLGGNGRN